MSAIDVIFEALGETWRVSGEFTPTRPGRTTGPIDNCYDADPAEWDDVSVVMIGSEGESPEMWGLMERLRAPGSAGSALDHILEMAELTWLRDRDARAAGDDYYGQEAA